MAISLKQIASISKKIKKKLTEMVCCSLLKSHQLDKFFYSQYYIILF